MIHLGKNFKQQNKTLEKKTNFIKKWINLLINCLK